MRTPWIVVSILWLGVIWWFSLAGNLPMAPPSVPMGDKLGHAVAYGVLALPAFMACYPRSATAGGWGILLLGVTLNGVLLEFLQRAMNHGRNFEVGDMVANGVGATVGVMVGMAMVRRGR